MTTVAAPLNRQSLTVNHVLQRCRMNDPHHVRRMNVCSSSLDDITVMRQFGNVEVCSFSANDICDLEALRDCGRLTELHLRRNRIADFMQLLHLSHLPLRSVGLSENPICAHPAYRKLTISALPSLVRLDDVDITAAERSEAEREISDPFAAAMAIGVVGGGAPSVQPLASAASRAGTVHSAAMGAGVSEVSATTAPLTLSERRQRYKQQQQQPLYDQQPQAAAATTRAPALREAAPSVSPYAAALRADDDGAANRYNGDDVPIGGGGLGGFVARPRVVSASGKKPNVRRDPFATAGVAADSVDRVPAASAGAARPAANFAGASHVTAQAPAFSEEAAVTAVKVLLESMSAAGIAQIKRHLQNLSS